jgi:uridine kinase
VSVSSISVPVHGVMRSEARTDARVTFPDGAVYSAPIGTPLVQFINTAYPPDHPDYPVLAAIVDNRLTELNMPVNRDIAVRPVFLHSSDGGRIYRRSLGFLMATAVEELYPGVKINVENAIPSGGFYCEPVDRPNFTRAELAGIKARMQEMVAANEPFFRKQVPLVEARAMFKERGDTDKLRLLDYRDKNYVTLYTLRNNVDYFFGYMCDTTARLTLFDLTPADEGFVLIYPRPETHNTLQPYVKSVKLEAVFRQTKDWLRLVGVEDVGHLNQSIAANRFREEVLIAEALHSRYIAEIARVIAQQHAKGLRTVMIAGPSSAGKTTFSKRLAVQLMAYGIQPFTLAMDDFFVDREKTPLDETGAYDFESVYALDLPRFNHDLLALMSRTEVQLPHFDFQLGRSVPGHTVKLTNDHIIITEGIHGLNPALIQQIPAERVFRIYVSALTALNLDRHNRIPTTDVRLIRRITRDAERRGYTAQDTLDRWESVRRGEKRNIFPYQEYADVMFNSSLAYELSVIRPYVEPLLRQVEPDSSRYIEAKRLLAFLGWVRPMPADYVPDDSILREFVGGSILETYQPGTRHTNQAV